MFNYLYKILLVDDEQIIRMGLRKTIDWGSLGFKIIGEASNADEAMALITDLHPDVVITDIRMGKANGLSLLERLNEKNIECETIIFTGYDDFDYIHTALEFGIFAYLLKPPSIQKLEETMTRLRCKLENKSRAILAENVYSSHMKEQLIRDLIFNEADIKSIAEKNPFFAEFDNKNYMLAILSVDNCRNLKEHERKAVITLKEAVEYQICTSENMIIVIVLEQTKYLEAIFIADHESYDAVIASLDSVRNSFCRSTSLTLTIGTSGIFRNLHMMNKAFTNASSALKQKAIYGNNRILDYTCLKDEPSADCSMSENIINSIVHHIKKVEYDKAEEEIVHFFEGIKKVSDINISSIRESVIELAILIIRSTTSNTDTMILQYGRIIKPVIELQYVEILDDFQNYLLDLISSLKNMSEFHITELKNEIVKKTVEYIIAHYDQPLTVEYMAEKMFISARHLSRLFKQETNQTFNEYLTNYRMAKAKILLSSGEYKLYEVASLVGYSSTSYFCKLFKIVTGESHKKYFRA